MSKRIGFNAAPRKAIPELSVDTQVLERLLLTLEIGETAGYDDLTEAIGRDVRTEGRHVLRSAQQRLLKLHGRVYAAVREVGVKRLDDTGIIGVGQSAVRAIHSKARRTAHKLAAVTDYDALGREDQVRLNTMRAQVGVLAEVTRPRQIKRLEERVGDKLAPTTEMLTAMKETL